MPAPRKYPDERERSLRLVAEAMAEDPGLSPNGAVKRIGPRVGVVPDTLRGWAKQMRVDAGQRTGTTTSDAATIKQLQAEVRELKRANEILLAASSFFARGNDPNCACCQIGPGDSAVWFAASHASNDPFVLAMSRSRRKSASSGVKSKVARVNQSSGGAGDCDRILMLPGRLRQRRLRREAPPVYPEWPPTAVSSLRSSCYYFGCRIDRAQPTKRYSAYASVCPLPGGR